MRKLWVRWMAFFAVCLWIVAGLALPATAVGQTPKSAENFYVADYANVLDASTEQKIIAVNESLFAQCGGQVVVVAVDFLNGTAIEDYAYALFNEWGIGSRENNNGVLILMAIGEENYYMLQGTGLEDAMSASVMRSILDDCMEPDFAVGDYDAAAWKTFEAAVAVIEDAYGIQVGNAPAVPPKTASSEKTHPVVQQPVRNRSFFGWIGDLIGRIVAFVLRLGLGLVVLIVAVVLLFLRPFRGGGGGYRRYRYGPPPPPPFVRPRGFRPPRSFGGGRPGGFGNGASRGFSGGGRSSGFGGSGRSRSFGGGSHSGGGGASRGGGVGRR